jgi:hypothetical protein
VARTGQRIRVEDYQQDVGRWFDVYFSRVDKSGRFVAIVFKDISERKVRRVRRHHDERHGRCGKKSLIPLFALAQRCLGALLP